MTIDSTSYRFVNGCFKFYEIRYIIYIKLRSTRPLVCILTFYADVTGGSGFSVLTMSSDDPGSAGLSVTTFIAHWPREPTTSRIAILATDAGDPSYSGWTCDGWASRVTVGRGRRLGRGSRVCLNVYMCVRAWLMRNYICLAKIKHILQYFY